MRKVIFFIGTSVAFILALMACGDNGPTSSGTIYADTSYANTTPHNTSRGKELFQQKCVACHGLNGNYRNNNAADLSLTKLDSIGIVTTIRNGKGAMPMFGPLFPDSDLAQIEMYVKTLRK